MKFLATGLLVLSFNSFAATSSAVYCKIDGEVSNILSREWSSCNDELYFGNVCFVGNRKEVITILNSEEVRAKYVGTDGEYISDANYYGPSDISYIAYDDANGLSEKYTIKRCSKKFFQ